MLALEYHQTGYEDEITVLLWPVGLAGLLA